MWRRCTVPLSRSKPVQTESIALLLPGLKAAWCHVERLAFSLKDIGEEEFIQVRDADEVISVCNPTMKGQTFPYVNSSVEAQMEAARNEKSDREAKERHDKDELRLRSEKVEEDQAMKIYYQCLVRHARILSLNSREPAEIIAKAAFPSLL